MYFIYIHRDISQQFQDKDYSVFLETIGSQLLADTFFGGRGSIINYLGGNEGNH